MRFVMQRRAPRGQWETFDSVLRLMRLVGIGACVAGCGDDLTQVEQGERAASDRRQPIESAVSVAQFSLESSRWVVAPDFDLELVASGFELPVGIAMVPNPRPEADAPIFYVVELRGTIKAVARSGVVSQYAEGLLNFAPDSRVPGPGEVGLGGAVVDPDTGDLYVTLVYREPAGSENGSLYAAVERLTSDDTGLSAVARARILNLAPEGQAARHQVSSITFGPDGYLYVHVGDGGDASAARNLTQFRGKILRLTKDGSAVSRNPYWDPFNGISARDYILASGIGSGSAGAWRWSDAAHYFVEKGPTVDRFAQLSLGRDYLYDGSDESMANFAVFNWNPGSAPANLAFIQQDVFERSGFPAEYEGRAYVTQAGLAGALGPGDAVRKAITEWTIDGRGELVAGGRPVAFYAGNGASTAAALAAGPDGIYFSDLYAEVYANGFASPSANVFRLRYKTPPPPADCNGNDVPDEDELALDDDCNRNGIPDECDIAVERSTDCNENALPDECEVERDRTFEFSYGVEGLTLNGSAQWIDGALRLTPATGGTGSAVHSPISDEPLEHLRAELDFKIGAGSGADGLSVALFDATRYPQTEVFGEDGPISGALVVKLNTYDNGDGANNVQVAFNGQSFGTYEPSFLLRDNSFHRLRLLLQNGRITVLISSKPGQFETAFDELPIPNYVAFVARIGFGARTGGYTDEHWVDNFRFWVPSPQDRNASGMLDVCECVADVDDGQGWGVPDGTVDSQDVVYFLHAYVNEGAYADVDDGSSTGRRDGIVNQRDLEYFLARFDMGC